MFNFIWQPMQALPIDSHLPRIVQALNESKKVMVTAEPGSGKTSRVPPALLSLGPCLVLQPRRLATRLAAERVASEMAVVCGEEVGFVTRYESRRSESTRLLFATEAMLLRFLRNDSKLEAFKTVVLDEFHERHLHTDAALLALRVIQEQRPDLGILIMSATIEVRPLEAYFGNGLRSFSIRGRSFPVKLEYMPNYQGNSVRSIAKSAIDMSEISECSGDILIFLTGVREIQAVAKELERLVINRKEKLLILPLYANLPLAEQQKVFSPSHLKKLVLATNVAETSVTIDGITGVIDPGFAKVARFASWSGLPSLQTERIAQHACIQRMGRAGRTQAGICWRLFDESDFRRRPVSNEPEIERQELSGLILDISSLYEGEELDELPWFTPLPKKSLMMSRTLLQNISALDETGRITEWGQKLAQIPLHPRLAQVLALGMQENIPGQAALIVCIVSEGGLWKNHHRAVDHSACDLCYQAKIFLLSEQNLELPHVALEKAMDRGRKQAIKSTYKQLAKARKLPALKSLEITKECEKILRELIFRAFSDRIARFRPAGKSKKNPGLRSFHFCQGGGGILGEASTVRKHPYLVVVDAIENLNVGNAAQRIQIQAATAVDEERLLQNSNMHRQEVNWIDDKQSGNPLLVEQHYYHNVKISEKAVSSGEQHDAAFWLPLILERWPFPFASSSDLDLYHAKVDLLDHYQIPHNLPKFTGDMLELLVADMLETSKTPQEISKKKLSHYIYRQLSVADHSWLTHLFPERVKVCNGFETKLLYHEGKFAIQGRVQQFFGCHEHPTLLDSRHPLLIILLAPNRRPAQLTENISQFWKGSYKLVRKELKHRYPKHDWPEKP